MLHDTAYPASLPLSRKAGLELLGRLEEFGSAAGTFLTFVEIPLEERIGEWRFAGDGASLTDALRRVEDFAVTMGLHDPAGSEGFLHGLLRDTSDSGYDSKSMYPRVAPREVGGPHRVVLCVRYGAPYEGVGVCVVEVESLAGSSFADRAPEADYPKQWRKMAIKWVLTEGVERFGSIPTAVKKAIRAETRPEVWGGWQRRWEEFGGWDELIPNP